MRFEEAHFSSNIHATNPDHFNFENEYKFDCLFRQIHIRQFNNEKLKNDVRLG